jgi:hypothetical protein
MVYGVTDEVTRLGCSMIGGWNLDRDSQKALGKLIHQGNLVYSKFILVVRL